MLKMDSCVMLSSKDYVEFIKPVNQEALTALGTGGVHWCGKGDQWRTEIADTKGVACLDWGNPDMMDLATWSTVLSERRLPIDKMAWKAVDFTRVAPQELFPTGACFTVNADTFDEAGSLLRGS